MRALITVGMGFGDEGKGATVDYLVRQQQASWVVRYSGGAQAGHNVELPEPLANATTNELRHTFSQFGAGTLAGAGTYLGPRVILCPAALQNEAAHLQEMGVASPLTRYRVHPDCLISTIYHIAANRLKELARGDGRHGSCGLGMGESRRYWLDHPDDAIVAADLTDTCRLRSKLNKLKRRLVLQMQQVAGQSSCPSNEEAFHDTWRLLHETTPEEEEDQLQQAAGDVTLSKDLPDCETAVFEGAQGVLLDEWCGFHPYTTWSTVTAQHAMEMLDETPTDSAHDITVLGVTRGYATRHGAGPFPTELGSYNVVRPTLGNPTNSWQGCLRSGPLDLVLLRYACRMCPIDALVVNCLDQLPEEPSVCRQYNSASGEIRELTPPHGLEEQSELTKLLETVTADSQPCSREELLHELSTLAKVVLRGHGPTFRDRSAAATAFGLSGHR